MDATGDPWAWVMAIFGSIAVWFLGLVLISILVAGIGVVVFGPREIDSLIIPAMATFGVLSVLITAPATGLHPVTLVWVSAAVGIGSAGIQRVLIDRWGELTTCRPGLRLASGVAAGAAVGGVLGFVFYSRAAATVVVGIALVGAVLGGMLSLRGDDR
ncbi:MAG TPA: hypothetical protein VHM48_07800 [Candidatus Limnocylindrales bacterium]|nr:hypothetical protein [Candidatus Limnocylindrales bacterium]